MLILTALAVAIAAPGPVQAVEHVDVAHDQLVNGENELAIEHIIANAELDRDDPSRLINLGVAYAREGREEQARAMFQAALYAEERQMVETSNGQWVDSRVLARNALALLDSGKLSKPTLIAAVD